MLTFKPYDKRACQNDSHSFIRIHAQLYNGSICRDTLSSKLKSNMNAHDLNAWIREGSEGNSVKAALEDLKAAAPTILSLPSSLSSSSSVSNPFYSSTHSRPRLQSVYFTNDGLLTSFDPEGNTLWRVQTQSSWLTTQTEARDSASGNQRVMHRKKRHLNKGKMQKQEDVFLRKIHQLSMQPSATPFKVFNNVDHSRSHSRNHRGEKYLLAVGEDTLSLLDREGNVISDISVFDVPVAKPCVGDFNNDDLNDIIIITTAGYYGYTVRHRIGSALFTVLVCFLLVCLTLTFVYKMVLSLESKKDFRRRRKGRID